MVNRFASLFAHEREALLAALRRDAQSQLMLAASNAHEAEYHMFNYRAVIRLLDVLSPKEGHRVATPVHMPPQLEAPSAITEAV